MTPVLTVIGILVVSAFITTIASAVGKCPIWVPVLLLCVVELVRLYPVGK